MLVKAQILILRTSNTNIPKSEIVGSSNENNTKNDKSQNNYHSFILDHATNVTHKEHNAAEMEKTQSKQKLPKVDIMKPDNLACAMLVLLGISISPIFLFSQPEDTFIENASSPKFSSFVCCCSSSIAFGSRILKFPDILLPLFSLASNCKSFECYQQKIQWLPSTTMR